MSYKYQSAVLGGTFDHFHLGHEQFIAAALRKTKHLTIGIVAHSNSHKAYPSSLQDFAKRHQALSLFLRRTNTLARTTLIPIHDIFGTTLTDPNIEAIFVTESTKPNAKVINKERFRLGLAPLSLVIVPYVLGDDGQVVRSKGIRAGTIDRQGTSYLKWFLHSKQYCLPHNRRNSLRQPIGTVVASPAEAAQLIPKNAQIISVGDIVSLALLQAGFKPAASIVDYRTRRRKLKPESYTQHFPPPTAQLTNRAGSINPQIAEVLLASLSTHRDTGLTQLIAVNGEEDLLALPAILLSPLDSYVIYGQHSLGMVIVEVTEKTKKLAKQHLQSWL